MHGFIVVWLPLHLINIGSKESLSLTILTNEQCTCTCTSRSQLLISYDCVHIFHNYHSLHVLLTNATGAVCYAELGCMIKESGGSYAYQRIGLGNPFGYMLAWQTVIALKPSGGAIIALTCSEYILSMFFTDDCGIAPDVMIKILAIIVVCTYTNYYIDVS